MPSPLLSIRNLKVSFSHDREWVEAIHGIDLDVFAGRTLGLVGESGSGKSVSSLAVMRLLNEKISRIKVDSFSILRTASSNRFVGCFRDIKSNETNSNICKGD